MANSEFLRKNKNQHSVKNSLSKKMDKNIDIATDIVQKKLEEEYPNLSFERQKRMKLNIIINDLKINFPQLSGYFSDVKDTSFISPDGGFLYAINSRNEKRLILVSEVKRQGTNNKRKIEGKKVQAKGNAIERLGKNLIGIRSMFKHKGILPFVCFGYGDDFKEDSTILDRVITMNDFFKLNEIIVEKDFLPFEPASLFFREKEWKENEMIEILHEVAKKSIESEFNI